LPDDVCSHLDGPDTDLADLAALMLDTRIRSVPILANGHLVGIVSARDVLRAVARRQLDSPDVRHPPGSIPSGRSSAAL